MKYKQLIAESEPSQQHEEINDLLLELENYDIKRVLEIGVHRGGSVRVWQRVFKPLLMIGINITREIEGKEDFRLIIGDSHSNSIKQLVVDLLNGEKLDFLFIDGDHMYNGVKKDFEMYSPLVRQGGIVAFHDVILRGNQACEVYKYWEELKAKYKTRTISYKEQLGDCATGCGIIYL